MPSSKSGKEVKKREALRLMIQMSTLSSLVHDSSDEDKVAKKNQRPRKAKNRTGKSHRKPDENSFVPNISFDTVERAKSNAIPNFGASSLQHAKPFSSLLGAAGSNPASNSAFRSIPSFGLLEDVSFDEWKKNNPCLLDMHVGHAAREHKLSREQWQGELSERWQRNREAWNAVRHMAAIKSPEEIAEAFKVDISRWEATSNIALLIDIAESMAKETRLWDGSSTADPPKPKAHVWPDGMKPIKRTAGPASRASSAKSFSSSPKTKVKKKRPLKRKHLQSPEVANQFSATSPNVVSHASSDGQLSNPEARELFPVANPRRSDQSPSLLENHGGRIQVLETSLWQVQSNIASLQLDQKRAEMLSVMALEKLGISSETIHARLASLPTRTDPGNEPRLPGPPPAVGPADAGQASGAAPMDADEQEPATEDLSMPLARLKISCLRRVLIDNGMPEDKTQILQGKKQLAFRLSWTLPHGLPVIVSLMEWPEKQSFLHVKLARVVALINGSLAFSWSPACKLDPLTPLAELPTNPPGDDVYTVELDSIFLQPESAEKRVLRANPPAKRRSGEGQANPLDAGQHPDPTVAHTNQECASSSASFVSSPAVLPSGQAPAQA